MKKRTAFTLVELLVVMAIIGILAGILFPALGGIRKKARRTQSHNLVTQVEAAWTVHFNDFRSFPAPDLFEDKKMVGKDVKFPMTPQNLALLNWRTKKPLDYGGKAAAWDKDIGEAAAKAIAKGSPNKPRKLEFEAENKEGERLTYTVPTRDAYFEIDNIQWVVGVVNTWGARAAQKGFNQGGVSGAKSAFSKYLSDANHADPLVWVCLDADYQGSVSSSASAEESDEESDDDSGDDSADDSNDGIHKVAIAWVNSENKGDKVIESW